MRVLRKLDFVFLSFVNYFSELSTTKRDVFFSLTYSDWLTNSTFNKSEGTFNGLLILLTTAHHCWFSICWYQFWFSSSDYHDWWKNSKIWHLFLSNSQRLSLREEYCLLKPGFCPMTNRPTMKCAWFTWDSLWIAHRSKCRYSKLKNHWHNFVKYFELEIRNLIE